MSKILIVDDSFPDRELVKEILSESNVRYEIETADSGRNALERVETFQPDLVLLDLRMADVNGFETLKTLREKGRQIPVLLVSSFTEENDRLHGLELGATDFIDKPISPEALKARVAVQMKLKKAYDDMQWAANQTNKGIKLLYKELEIKNDKLKELDQLKSNFISMVSHELRTPLAIIRQGVSMMKRRILGEVNEQQEETLNDVLDNIDRLVKIINDLLDISKLEAAKVALDKKQVDAAQQIRYIIGLFQTKAQEKNITLLARMPDGLPAVFGDRDRVIQILTNLVNNALKFTPENGRVTVSARDREEFVEFAVSDTGIGISEDNMNKLFNKFEQFGRTNGPGEKGTGLGLAISKELINLHDGQIWAESKENQGTTFFFTIPKSQDKNR